MYERGMPIIKSKLLLGEGIEEVYFFNALLDHLGITDVQVDQYDGKSRIAAGLRAIKDRSGFINQVVSVGVTRDADYADDPADDPAAAQRAFLSVSGALASANLPVPMAANGQSCRKTRGQRIHHAGQSEARNARRPLPLINGCS